jgi:hypothetical protein
MLEQVRELVFGCIFWMNASEGFRPNGHISKGRFGSTRFPKTKRSELKMVVGVPDEAGDSTATRVQPGIRGPKKYSPASGIAHHHQSAWYSDLMCPFRNLLVR